MIDVSGLNTDGATVLRGKLHPIHDAYRTQFTQLHAEEFVGYVCSERVALPTHKSTSYMTYVPCTDLNGTIIPWGSQTQYDIMLVLPATDPSSTAYARPLCDRMGLLLRNLLREAGYSDDEVLVTHAIRHCLPPGSKNYSEAHRIACSTYAVADIIAHNPGVVGLLGAPSLKALFGRNAKLENYRGQPHAWGSSQVLAMPSHLSFAKSQAGIDVFLEELRSLRHVLVGQHVSMRHKHRPRDYRYAHTVGDVRELVDYILQQVDKQEWKAVVVDTEFGNTVAREEYNVIRSVQLSWGTQTAAYIPFRNCGGGDYWPPESFAVVKAELMRVLDHPDVQLVGHNLAVDIDMLHREGMDVDHKLPNGFCTMLAHHALYGDDTQGLDTLTRKYCPEFGAYWAGVNEWVKNSGGEKQLLFGYMNVPEDVLAPYAMADVDVTYTAALKIRAELQEVPSLWELYTQLEMPTALHLLDIQRNGILIDDERRMQLKAAYEPEYEAALADFRNAINWPDFNPNSWQQKCQVLFGTTRYKDWTPLPEGAVCLGLTPVQTNEKYPKAWEAVRKDKQEHLYTPGTDNECLDLLYADHKDVVELKLLRQLSILGKFLSTYLQPQVLNAYGVPEDGANICNHIWRDGRVRTHFAQYSQTGRYRSFRPNLQTNPKKQEYAAREVFIERRYGMSSKEYDKKCKSGEIPKERQLDVPSFKSCYMAPPDHVLMEVDFATAELCVLAYCSGDVLLTQIIDMGRDMHSETACRAFRLPLMQEMEDAIEDLRKRDRKFNYDHADDDMKTWPYYVWIEKIKTNYKSLRIAAKTVTFGIMYGRKAPALHREITKTGVVITMREVEELVAGFATTYSRGFEWMQKNMDHAIEHGWVANPFGRRRWFTGIDHWTREQQAAARREASNSPIQGAVADLLRRAGVSLYRLRYHSDIGRKVQFKVVLPIHDAFLFEVHKDRVREMEAIATLAMSNANPIPGTDNRCLGVDITVSERW